MTCEKNQNLLADSSTGKKNLIREKYGLISFSSVGKVAYFLREVVIGVFFLPISMVKKNFLSNINFSR